MRSIRHLRSLLDEARAADRARNSVLEGLATSNDNAGRMSDELRRAVDHWKTWFGRRDELKARVLPEVTRWEWSTGRRYSLLPVHFERYPGRGRLLKDPPQPRSQHTQSGLGADGRFLVQRVFDYQDHAFEQYVAYGNPVTDIVEFSPGPHIPTEHGRIERDGAKVVRFESFRLNGYTPKMGAMGRSPDRLAEWLGPNGRFLVVEEYRYDGDLLREIEVYGETPGLGPHRYVDRLSHDADGSLSGIDRTWENGHAQTVYRRRRRGQTLDELRAAAVAELVPAVIDIAGSLGATGPVYCLELSYQAVSQYFPPLVTLGFESDRERLREPDLAFRPMLSGGRTVELPDPDRMEACRQFDQEVRARGEWPLGTRMLREAAATLTRHDWRGTLDVTDDFVAFVIDPELDELDEALSASASHEQVAAWRARGWL